jgi:hypothetical protein
VTLLRPSASNSRSGRPLGEKTLAIREAVLELTAEYDVMTVRQIFYALTVRGVVPKDENAGYRSVQQQVLKMRRDGLLPWDFVADATRWMRVPSGLYDSMEDALRETQRTYRRNLWRSQDVRIEVWLEKDALASIVQTAAFRWNVTLLVSRGTSSATFLHEAAQEAFAWWDEGVKTIVYALYDFDAAGERAARAIRRGFGEHAPGIPITFERLAVTEAQIEEWNLPTRPAKKSDPEASKFGAEAVELDAIPPDKLTSLIEQAIRRQIDPQAWRMEQATEKSEREILARMAGVAA